MGWAMTARVSRLWPREYKAWTNMRDRCHRQSHKQFHRYGGRGITICKRWGSFADFLADMGPCPVGYSLERAKNDRNYNARNCVWATQHDQTRNRSTNRKLTFRGETRCVTEWAERLGSSRTMIYQRLYRGWSIEDALVK